MRSPQPPIPKPAKSSAPPESRIRPGYETPAISAGAAVACRARRKLACFCSAPMAGFYSAVDIPGTYRPHTGLPGVAEHFIAYCSTAFAFALGFRSSASRIVIALVLTLLAGSMEVLQLWVPGRHSAIIDAVFSSLGGLLGIALGGLLLVLAAQGYGKHRHLGESAELVQ
jgi:VanZ family protein